MNTEIFGNNNDAIKKNVQDKGLDWDKIEDYLGELKIQEKLGEIETYYNKLTSGVENTVQENTDTLVSILKKSQGGIEQFYADTKGEIKEKTKEIVSEEINGMMSNLGDTKLQILGFFGITGASIAGAVVGGVETTEKAGFMNFFSNIFTKIKNKIVENFTGINMSDLYNDAKSKAGDLVDNIPFISSEKDDSPTNKKTENSQAKTNVEKVDTVIKQQSDSAEKKIAENKETIEVVKKDLYYKTGVNYLLYYSGINQGSNNGKSPMISKICESGETISELSIDSGNKQMIEGLQNEKTKTLLNFHLKSGVLKNSLTNFKGEKKENLANLFHSTEVNGEERFHEIMRLVNNRTPSETIDYSKLSVGEISILLTLTMNFVGMFKYKEADKFTQSIPNIDGINKDDLKKLSENFQDSTISPEIIGVFTAMSASDFGGSDYLEDNISNKKEFSEINKEELTRLNDFKEYIQSDNFLRTNELNLGDFKESFKAKLNYQKIIMLYNTMGGRHEVNNGNLLPTVLGIQHILGTGIGDAKSGYEGMKYITDIGYIALFETNSNIFTQEQKDVFKIYLEKNAKLMAGIQLKDLSGYFGVMNSMNKNWEITIGGLAMGLGAGGLGKIIESKSLKKGSISRIGMLLRTFGYLGVGVGIISLFSKAYEMSGTDLGKDIKEALGNDPDGKDTNYKEIVSIIERIKDPEHSTIIDKSTGENQVSMSHYKGDKPLFIMGDKVFALKLQGYNVNEKNHKHNGLDIDLNEIRIEDSKITIGRSENSMTINKTSLINSLRNGENKIWDDNYVKITEKGKKYINKGTEFFDEAKEGLRDMLKDNDLNTAAEMLPGWNIPKFDEDGKQLSYKYKEIPGTQVELLEIFDIGESFSSPNK